MITLKICLSVVTQVCHDDPALSGDTSDPDEVNIAVRVAHGEIARARSLWWNPTYSMLDARLSLIHRRHGVFQQCRPHISYHISLLLRHSSKGK